MSIFEILALFLLALNLGATIDLHRCVIRWAERFYEQKTKE